MNSRSLSSKGEVSQIEKIIHRKGTPSIKNFCPPLSNRFVKSLIIRRKVQPNKNPECGEPFHCPDECVITWYGKCPSNCYCKPIKRCETVKCPHPAPKCIIVTGQDGCQRCACENDMEAVNKAAERERMNTKTTKTTTLADEASVPSETTTPTTTTTTTTTTTATPTPTAAEISETPKFVTRLLTTGQVTTPTTVTETWTTKPFLLQSTTVDLPIRNSKFD
ncbi:hypothetical protein Tsp_04313 [Trichinella spiralis]|uniref:hypothetical protein n=1 Tax=Trichinella spiralis TaxID=6334 RepID=UPI0001EFC2F7|nr:hypothetical protein Tsp_04313 [Trichinella spiralis]